MAPTAAPSGKTPPRELSGVFDYHKCVVVQCSMLRNGVNTELLDLIDQGRVDDIEPERINALLNIYPSEKEIQATVAKLKGLGIPSFQEALILIDQGQLTCD